MQTRNLFLCVLNNSKRLGNKYGIVHVLCWTATPKNLFFTPVSYALAKFLSFLQKYLREHSGRKMKKKQFSSIFSIISSKDVFLEKLIARNVLTKQVAPFSAETGQR